MNTAVTIIIAVLGSTGLSTLIQYFVSRHDKKHDRLAQIEKKLDKTEKDSVRLQLLFLIKMMPTETQEILACAQHYFCDLDGNWYATSLFFRWMQEYKVARPQWFKGETVE
jgi:hypothetical protein